MRDEKKVVALVKKLLDELGAPYPKHSPTAIARTLLDYTKGYAEPQLKVILPLTFEAPRAAQIIEIADIRFYTLCEHHLLPFLGFVTVRYVPDERIIGLSKPKRLIHHLSHRLQIQERFTQDILDYLWELVEPIAMSVEVRARHLCAEMRGARAENEWVTTLTKKFKNTASKEVWEGRI